VGLLGIAFMIILFAALVSYLATSSSKAPEVTAAGLKVLRVNRGYAIIACIGTALIALLLVLMFRRPGKTVAVFPMIIGIALGSLAVCVPVVLATVRLRVEFDRQIIRHHGTWGKVKEIRWAEIRQVKFSKARLELSLFGASTTISLNMHMIGFPVFLEAMKEKLDPEMIRDAVSVIDAQKKKL
jgi:multidrug transporter EmrE-like cation transporter